MEISIREYQDTDRPVVELLMKAFNDYFERIDPWQVLKYKATSAMFYTDRMIADSKAHDGVIFVAEVDGHVVGFIQGSMHEQTEIEIQERGHVVSGDIKELFVDEKYQRQSIGELLMDKMEQYFLDKGCLQIALDVFAPNEKARKFYKKMGFTERALILVKRLPTH